MSSTQYQPLREVRFPANLDTQKYKSWLQIRMGTRKTDYIIVLPTPSNISFSTNISYNDISLGIIDSVFDTFTDSMKSGKGIAESAFDAGKGLINNSINSDYAKESGLSTQIALASALFRNLKISSMNQVLEGLDVLARKELRDQGVAINPNTELYFQDVGLRSFNFTFKLMARNALDSYAIKHIVKAFEYAAHPERRGNVLYSYPDECILTFFEGDAPNDNIPAINRCVIKSFSHTYNVDSNVFFENGMPSSVDIAITFQEISVNTRETINNLQSDTERQKFSKRKAMANNGIDILKTSGDLNDALPWLGNMGEKILSSVTTPTNLNGHPYSRLGSLTEFGIKDIGYTPTDPILKKAW